MRQSTAFALFTLSFFCAVIIPASYFALIYVPPWFGMPSFDPMTGVYGILFPDIYTVYLTMYILGGVGGGLALFFLLLTLQASKCPSENYSLTKGECIA